MDDEKHEKQMMRNQMIAMVLLTIMMMVFFQYFVPGAGQRPAAQPGAQQGAASEKAASQKAATPEQSAPEPAQKPEIPQLAGLPEIPTVTEPAAEEVALASDGLELVFTKIGGRLKRAKVLAGENPIQLVPEEENALPDTEAVYPLGLHFSDPKLGDALDSRRFEVEKDPSGKAITFSLTVPNTFTVRKRFALDERTRVLSIGVEYQNLGAQAAVLGVDQTPAYYLNWAPNVSSGDELLGLKQAFVWRKGGVVEELATASMAGKDGQEFVKEVADPEWAAVKSAYFVVAMKPENFEKTQAWLYGQPHRFRFGLSVPRFEVAANAVQANTFSLYLGPSEQSMLAGGWKTLPSVFRFFQPPWSLMDWFAKFLLRVLNAFYAVIPNYGLAIIFLTVLVRLGMYPLTLKSMKSMKKMQLLGPEMEALKAKHGDDPQVLNQKMMELYRERGVNPMGGCLPMLLQMPVFIALYRMLWCAFELRGAPFFGWMTDLSQPDRMLHMPWMKAVPMIGPTFEYLNLLPILMGIAMVVSQKIMPQTATMPNQQQKIMLIFMPVFFSFICYTMASGLNLYILTSTILGMVQQKYTSVSDEELKAKKAIGKRQHFYTAAKARQRQRAREAKREKRP